MEKRDLTFLLVLWVIIGLVISFLIYKSLNMMVLSYEQTSDHINAASRSR